MSVMFLVLLIFSIAIINYPEHKYFVIISYNSFIFPQLLYLTKQLNMQIVQNFLTFRHSPIEWNRDIALISFNRLNMNAFLASLFKQTVKGTVSRDGG
jgi:hypothetical protein